MLIVHNRFSIKIVPTGSFYDQAKVGNPDEFDYVAELQPLSRQAGVTFSATTDPAFLQVSLNNVVLKKRYRQFLCHTHELRQHKEANAMLVVLQRCKFHVHH